MICSRYPRFGALPHDNSNLGLRLGLLSGKIAE